MKPAKLTATVDRMEGLRAVLTLDDGNEFTLPKRKMPGVKPGMRLVLTITRSEGEERAIKEDTEELQEELKRRDDGKDVQL